MDRWKVTHTQYVLARNRELKISVVLQPTAKFTRINRKVGSSKALLNGDLPQTHDAEPKFIRLVQ